MRAPKGYRIIPNQGGRGFSYVPSRAAPIGKFANRGDALIAAWEASGDPLCQCANCEEMVPFSMLAKALDECADLGERLDAGSEVPAGECHCGAFSYFVKRGE